LGSLGLGYGELGFDLKDQRTVQDICVNVDAKIKTSIFSGFIQSENYFSFLIFLCVVFILNNIALSFY
jgi:hypothetical protein